ncbi:MAG: ribonuclease E activity regulator RraA [Thermaerobacter sp.]|nr:ribonuclease E activity regulator RraA [Thermaerobacter sp.]
MFHTADIADAWPDRIAVCELAFISFAKRGAFHGPIHTVQVFEDNVLVKAGIEGAPAGSVLVVDGGGSHRCALLGGNLAALAASRGLTGIIINGCVRDSHELAQIDIGILAIGRSPVKSRKTGSGQVNVALCFGGVTWNPGQFVYADQDGVILTAQAFGGALS